MKYLIAFIFCCLYLQPCKAQYFDTVTLHYNIGESVLNNKNKAASIPSYKISATEKY